MAYGVTSPAARAYNLTPEEIDAAPGDWSAIEIYPSGAADRIAALCGAISWVPKKITKTKCGHTLAVNAFLNYAFTTATEVDAFNAVDELDLPQPEFLIYPPRLLRGELSRFAGVCMADPSLSIIDDLIPDSWCIVLSGAYRHVDPYRVKCVRGLRVLLYPHGLGETLDVEIARVESCSPPDDTPVKLRSREHRRRHASIEEFQYSRG